MPDTPLNPDARTECVDMLIEIMGYPRDELFEYPNRADDSIRYITRAERTLDKILAVAQPEVNSVEELDALPAGSYVQGWDWFKHAKTHSGDWVLCVEHTRGAHKAESIELPARVLYRPTEETRDGL